MVKLAVKKIQIVDTDEVIEKIKNDEHLRIRQAADDNNRGRIASQAYSVLKEICSETTKTITISNRSKRWWNLEISDKVKELRKLTRRKNKYLSWRYIVRIEFCKSTLKKMIKKAKQECWKRFIEEQDAAPGGIWNVVRILKDPFKSTSLMPGILLNGEEKAYTDEEKVEMLTHRDFEQRTDRWQFKFGGLTSIDKPTALKEIREALQRTKNNSAPSPDGITYRLLKEIKDTALGTELLDDLAESLCNGTIYYSGD